MVGKVVVKRSIREVKEKFGSARPTADADQTASTVASTPGMEGFCPDKDPNPHSV